MPQSAGAPASFLKDGGEMGELIRTKDWSLNPVGTPDQWPQSLRITLNIILNSGFPMFLFWGPEHICFYNDPYRTSLGLDGKHPAALGAPGILIWPEIWPDIGPIIHQIMSGGPAYFSEDQLLPIYRNGRLEDVYWTFSYSPVVDDSGQPAGVFVTCIESTGKVMMMQRLAASESRFRNLVRQATVGVVVLRGEALKVEVVNEFYCQVIGKPYEAVIGQSIFEVIPETEEFFRHMIDFVKNSGEPIHLYDHPYFVYQGEHKKEGFLDVVYQPYRESDGEISGVIALVHDVTPQVMARKQLEYAEEKARLAIDAAGLGAFEINLNTGEVDTDARFNAIMGFDHWVSREDFVSVLHPDDREQRRKAYEVAEQTQHLQYEARVLHENNRLHWIRVVGRMYPDESGKPLKIIGLLQDITDQKIFAGELTRKVDEKTRALRLANEELEGILDASMNGIYSLEALRDEQGRITDFRFLSVNKVCTEVLGTLPEHIIGKGFLEVFPGNREEKFYGLFCQVVETGEPVREEVRLVRNGQDRWYQYMIVRLGRNGVVVTFLNITEQQENARQIRQQKELLDKLLVYSPSGISITEAIRGPDGTVVDWQTILANDAAARFTGLSREVLLTQSSRAIDPRLLASPISQAAQDTLLSGEPFIQQAFLEVTGRWLELSVARMDGDHLINIFTDVTSIKEAQLRLEHTVEELRRSNANLEEFAYAASHDLKEPVRKIRFFADRIKNTLSLRLSEEETQYFERLETATKRMGLLIDDLLSYSQISQDAPERESVDLNQLIGQVLSDLDLEIEQKQAQIELEPLAVVPGFQRQLHQAFFNLIGNALKYCRPGVAPRIRISGNTVSAADTGFNRSSAEQQIVYYRIEVKDNGIGFEQKDADRIFNVFQRLHGNADYRGTGIGLSIVRKVAEHHDGFVSAEGNPGAGACFRLWLPASR